MKVDFDQFRRQVDQSGFTDGMDEFHRQALDVLTSSRLADALDLTQEDEPVRRRHGLDRAYPEERERKTLLDPFLLARRVIEAGARCVTLAFSRCPFGRMLQGDYNWDWHKDAFAEARGTLPLFDLGLSALIGDLDESGLLDDIVVVAWGEFGRKAMKRNRNHCAVALRVVPFAKAGVGAIATQSYANTRYGPDGLKLIVREGWGYAGQTDRYRDLRVDDHASPIEELRRVYEVHRKTFPRPVAREKPQSGTQSS